MPNFSALASFLELSLTTPNLSALFLALSASVMAGDTATAFSAPSSAAAAAGASAAGAAAAAGASGFLAESAPGKVMRANFFGGGLSLSSSSLAAASPLPAAEAFSFSPALQNGKRNGLALAVLLHVKGSHVILVFQSSKASP